MRSPDLYRFDQATGETKQLTNTKWEEWRPVTSPDGRHVYYIANPDMKFDIFRLDFLSGKIEKVWGSEADEWDPDISPDGRWL
jgi:Tol biopolymer transport system component